jgi:hypothetical protein
MTAGALLLGALAVYSGRAEAAFGTDIIGQTAVSSFAAMLEALPKGSVEELDSVYRLNAPDGGAEFFWRFKLNDELSELLGDVYIVFDAEPFLAAGLDAGKLPSEDVRYSESSIVIGRALSKGPLIYDGEITAVSAFEQIVKLDREAIGYHSALDHYGITLSDGNLVEWAKDMSKNDKDLVFVLNPKIFIDAGVDPAKVKGWIYAKVPLEDARGRKFEAERFLKPFNLK